MERAETKKTCDFFSYVSLDTKLFGTKEFFVKKSFFFVRLIFLRFFLPLVPEKIYIVKLNGAVNYVIKVIQSYFQVFLLTACLCPSFVVFFSFFDRDLFSDADGFGGPTKMNSIE